MIETDPISIIAALASALGLSFLGNIFQKITAGDLKGAIKEAIANKDAILDYFDYNSDVNTAPAELIRAELAGRNFFSLTDADRERIYSSCASAVEIQQIKLIIQNYEAAGTYEYTLETTGAGYKIQQGWIADIVPRKPANALNADGHKVGSAEVVGTSLSSGYTYAPEELAGKPLTAVYKVTDYGQLIFGAFYDGIPLGTAAATGNTIGEEKNFTTRLPQYLDKFGAGAHSIEFRTGRYAGHDDAKGDTVEWTGAPYTLKITVAQP